VIKNIELPKVRKEKSSQQQMTLTLQLFLRVCVYLRCGAKLMMKISGVWIINAPFNERKGENLLAPFAIFCDFYTH
jgi:hypothetical protein